MLGHERAPRSPAPMEQEDFVDRLPEILAVRQFDEKAAGGEIALT